MTIDLFQVKQSVGYTCTRVSFVYFQEIVTNNCVLNSYNKSKLNCFHLLLITLDKRIYVIPITHRHNLGNGYLLENFLNKCICIFLPTECLKIDENPFYIYKSHSVLVTMEIFVLLTQFR